MSSVPRKLVRAIVGLGLVAAGCGGEITTTTDEAGDANRGDARPRGPADATDHLVVNDSAGADANAEAPAPDDARIDAVAEAAVDAAMEAAADHWIPVPVK